MLYSSIVCTHLSLRPHSSPLLHPSMLTYLLLSSIPAIFSNFHTSVPLTASSSLYSLLFFFLFASPHPWFPLPLYLSPLVQKFFSSYFLSFYNSTTLRLSLSSYIHPPISALHLCRFIFCQFLHLLQSTILHHSIFMSSLLSSHFFYRTVKQCNTELLFRDQF